MSSPDYPASSFTNSIVGQQGTLVRSQIKSPNFSIPLQTGWAILKNGSAYFFNVTATGTITATAFIGTDFEITSQGGFYYYGPPAYGDLFLSMAPASGVDPFGNPFPQGIRIYSPAAAARGTASGLGQIAGAATMALVWATPPLAGSKVLVGIIGAQAAPTLVQDNGTAPSTFTLDASASGSGHANYIYRADGITLPAAGSYTVTITFGSSTVASAGGLAYSGVKAGGPRATSSAAGTGTAVATGNVTPSGASGVAFGVFDDRSGLAAETITLTAPGYVEQFTQINGSTYDAGGIADSLLSASGPTAATWTLGDSVAWGGLIAAYDLATATQGVILGVAAGVAYIAFPTGATEEFAAAQAQAFITTPGPTEVMRWFLNGPVGANTGATDSVSVYLSSAAKDGSSAAAGALVYNDLTGIHHQYANWGAKGLRLTSPFSGDTTSYQAERSSQILAGSVTINTTGLTDLFTATLGIGTYIFEGQIVITPAAGGTAGFQVAGPTGSSGIIWEDILLGGAPYTNEGAAYNDPAFAVQFNTPTLTTSKHRILFRGSCNLTAAGLFALIATEAGGASYVVNSRVTFLHIFPVGP